MKPKDIELTQPPKICPKCHKEIPANEWLVDELTGKVKTDDRGNGIRSRVALLNCEQCCLNAAPPPVPKVRRRRGEVDERQTSIDPGLYLRIS
jgi:hypothetical protein